MLVPGVEYRDAYRSDADTVPNKAKAIFGTPQDMIL
jgi:hypothetical protein